MSNIIDKFEKDYYFLSNFYPSKVIYEGIAYPSVEHAFQAAKSTDVTFRKHIAGIEQAGIAKRMGRQVELREDWEEIKEQVMEDCLRSKFEVPELRTKLISTHPAELVEGNYWHDNCWGNCTCDVCEKIEGRNLLGKLLMKIREELIARG